VCGFEWDGPPLHLLHLNINNGNPTQNTCAPTNHQDHLHAVTAAIRRWRDRVLTGQARASGAAGTGDGAVVGCASEPELCKTVAQCYALYSSLDGQYVYGSHAQQSGAADRTTRSGTSTSHASSMQAAVQQHHHHHHQQQQQQQQLDGSQALALDLPAFRRLLVDARICGAKRRHTAVGAAAGEGDGSVSVSDCQQLFEGLVSGATPIQSPVTPNPQQARGRNAAAVGRNTGGISAAAATAGGVGSNSPDAVRASLTKEQRQSTFMRAVAAERLAQLGVDPNGTSQHAQRDERRERRRVEKKVAARKHGRKASAAAKGRRKRSEAGVEGSSSSSVDEEESAANAHASGGDSSSSAAEDASAEGTGERGALTASSSDAETNSSSSAETSSAPGTGDSNGSPSATTTKPSTAATTDRARTDQQPLAALFSSCIDANASPSQAQPRRPCLTPVQFQEAVRRLAVVKFPRIANKSTAWRLLVERHIAPALQRRRNRFDVCSTALHTPGVAALLQAWQPEMQSLVQAAAVIATPSTEAASTARSAKAPPQQHEQQLRLSFHSLFMLLQDREAIPQLMQPADVEEGLRRLAFEGRSEVRPAISALGWAPAGLRSLCFAAVLYNSASTYQSSLLTHSLHHIARLKSNTPTLQLPNHPQSDLISDLTPSDFLESLALLGLSIFQTRRFKGTFAQPEQQLAAFFTHLGLPPLPVHEALMSGAATAAGSAAAGGEKMSSSSGQRVASPLVMSHASRDPYAEWWSMRFDDDTLLAKRRSNNDEEEAAAGSRSGVGGYRSSAFYNLVLLQVHFLVDCLDVCGRLEWHALGLYSLLMLITTKPLLMHSFTHDQEPVLPPPGCPAAVCRLIEASNSAHTQRRCEDALLLLQAAQEAWDKHLECLSDDGGSSSSGRDMAESSSGVDAGSSSSSWSEGSTQQHKQRRHYNRQPKQQKPQQQSSKAHKSKHQDQQQLVPAMTLFFGMAACGVLLTAGRDAEAWSALSKAAPALEWLHEAGADAASWHGAAGVVLYHLGELRVRFLLASVWVVWEGEGGRVEVVEDRVMACQHQESNQRSKLIRSHHPPPFAANIPAPSKPQTPPEGL